MEVLARSAASKKAWRSRKLMRVARNVSRQTTPGQSMEASVTEASALPRKTLSADNFIETGEADSMPIAPTTEPRVSPATRELTAAKSALATRSDLPDVLSPAEHTLYRLVNVGNALKAAAAGESLPAPATRPSVAPISAAAPHSVQRFFSVMNRLLAQIEADAARVTAAAAAVEVDFEQASDELADN
jgi:hypothetical protein